MMSKLLLTCALFFFVGCQISPNNADRNGLSRRNVPFQDVLHSMTLKIDVTHGDQQSSGSGVLFAEYNDRGISRLWIVTNKHVILDDHYNLPDSIMSWVRLRPNTGQAAVNFSMEKSQLGKVILFHPLPSHDLCLIRVDSIHRLFNQNLVYLDGVFNILSIVDKRSRSISAGDDVLIVGYPHGIMDSRTLFPIVKSGIVSSRWGAPFNGTPMFLVDGNIYPGMSGGVVIKKLVPNEELRVLGIVQSGMFVTEPKRTDLKSALAIYADEIPVVVTNGVNHETAKTVWDAMNEEKSSAVPQNEPSTQPSKPVDSAR